MTDNQNFLENFTCPITLEIMKDPVVDQQGISYERKAIEDWLDKGNSISPISRKPLKKEQLTSNLALKNMIEDWLKKNPDVDLEKLKKKEKKVDKNAAKNPIKVNRKITQKESQMPFSVDFKYDSDTKISNFILKSCDPRETTHYLGNLQRKPIHLVLCLDNSGSMSSPANAKKEDGNEEFTGMSVLDIVRACASAMVEALTEKDKISIVRFDSRGEELMSLKKMDAKGKLLANQTLNNIEPMGATNLWDGIRCSYESLKKADYDENVQEAIFVLTDGQPNQNPNRPYLAELRHYIEKNLCEKRQNSVPAITTFGFGYHLATKLLCSLADETNGKFVYIPDQGFVGTGMIHALSNTLSTLTQQAWLEIEVSDGAKFVQTGSGKNSSPVHAAGQVGQLQIPIISKDRDTSRQSIKITKNQLKYGDTKNILAQIDFSGATPMAECLKIRYGIGQKQVKELNFSCPGVDDQDNDTKFQLARVALVDALVKCYSIKSRNVQNPGGYSRFTGQVKIGEAKKVLKNFDLFLPSSSSATDDETEIKCDKIITHLVSYIEKMKGLIDQNESTTAHKIEELLKDIDGDEDSVGQIKEGLDLLISKDAFTKWGQHFIPSIMRAHLHQECNNFADPGIQNYGSDMFSHLRDFINDIYEELPPPKQSLKNHQGHLVANKAGATVTRHAGPIRMNMYNCRGGCFVGETLVNLSEDGKFLKKISDLKKDDMIWDPVTKKLEKVICLTKIIDSKNLPTPMVKMPGLPGITQYHPIFDETSKKWTFPINYRQVKNDGRTQNFQSSEPIFNLFTTGSAFKINNSYTVCSLGHEIQEPVVYHEYLGNRMKIEEDLRKCHGFGEGLVVLDQSTSFIRGTNNMISQIIEPVAMASKIKSF